ncbi:PREDICTED: uncharacterized protein LOC105457454 isoform X2 [Wasmannia auropunctata]|uniref:uncharacterized protein LOC105457454 isoform X2 n=1 Tax=Wasmannia auropunctata TaxID=64793 RepID=UPI0005EE0204|nr:PREDICTED: uncharacterized protein LOC105457454 isoform X2 [Wasmannia auropunctata]
MTVPNNMSMLTEDSKDTLKSSNEYRYVMMFKSTFERELFPNNFDMWTVQQQCMWINDNIAAFFSDIPKSLLDFIPVFFRPGDCQPTMLNVPEWLDMDKYRRGQKFVRENFASLLIGKILGTVLVYSFNEGLKPLIISKSSHTPYLGFKRYMSTIQRIICWYDGEPWIEGTPASKEMKIVRKMHLMIQSKLRELDDEQIDNKSKIVEPWCPDRELLLQDFAAACPHKKKEQSSFELVYKSPYKPKGVNNADMAGIQFGFISLVLICPQLIGVHNATDEDIEAFCHMWRCYGYYLGMEDRHNFCRGSLEEIKQRARDIYQYWLLPYLKEITPEWEHMTRCIIESMNYVPLLSFGLMPYKSMMLLAMDALNINMPHLYASMSYAEWILYKSWRFTLGYVLKFSCFRVIFNKIVLKIFVQAMNFSPEEKAKLKEKSEKQLPNVSTVD